MLGFLALVLFAMMFTSCKAKIGGAKAKVEAEEKAKEEVEEEAAKLSETQATLTQLESDLAAKKAEVEKLSK